MRGKAVFFAAALPALAAAWVPASPGAETPGAGRFDFNVCKFGKSDYPRLAESLVSSAFARIAAFVSGSGHSYDTDRPGPRCAGTYEVVGGKYRDSGVCTQVDADGDKWLMHYETGADLAGTWVAVDGSGKYRGMTARGEYAPAGNVRGVLAGGFKSCNRNTGTYRLK